jgi:hypothetical protein
MHLAAEIDVGRLRKKTESDFALLAWHADSDEGGE